MPFPGVPKLSGLIAEEEEALINMGDKMDNELNPNASSGLSLGG